MVACRRLSALVRDHAFAHRKLRFRTLRRSKPSFRLGLPSGKRMTSPEFTLCFRHGQRRSHLSATAPPPTPQCEGLE